MSSYAGPMPRDVVPILPFAAPRFAQQVELAVIRQDEVRLVADDQPVADVDAGLRELVDLGEQRLGIDDDAVADDAGDRRRAGSRTASGAARTSARPRRPCGRRCARPDNGRRSKNVGVSRSTILPLPSSPHWAPSTARFIDAVFYLRSACCRRRRDVPRSMSPSLTERP